MKLAEALSSRSEAIKKLESLRTRIRANALYQEGDKPQEDASALLDEASEVLASLEDLTRRINVTNTAATLESGQTLTAAIARRDHLRQKASLLSSAADAASGNGLSGIRQMRSELRVMSALDVQRVRGDADSVARELRQLDLQIQEANWRFDLVE
ncbi:MAG: DIP1984 family protein [Propionibacteriaceae bacterium]|nr:DIP1984 family protein [Propionibacteriaceae bacterium]